MLRVARADGLRTRALKIRLVYGGWVCEMVTCQWSMRPGAEGFSDAVMHGGGSVHGKGVIAVPFLLIVSSDCWARRGSLSGPIWLLIILSMRRGGTSGTPCQSSGVIEIGRVPYLLGFEVLLLGAIEDQLLTFATDSEKE